MGQILKAYDWLRGNYPGVTNGLSSRFFDVPIPYFDGMYLGENFILIDTRELNANAASPCEAQSEVVRVVAHELLHAQDGIIQTLLNDDAAHNEIFLRAELIRRAYLESLGGPNK